MIIKKKNQKKAVQTDINKPQVIEGSGVDENIHADNQEVIADINNEKKDNLLDIDLFNIENVDFNQRQERRRGSRRRGYRRIDDRNLVSRAQDEAENIKKSAFDEGYRCGLEKSSADITMFRNELVNFMSARKDVFEYIAPDILEISVDIAKKIIKKELETDPQVIINVIVDVLKTVSKSEPKITIKVRPQAVQFIKDTLPNITYQYGIEAKINIIADSAIEEGGCIFQTNNGIVDASIDTQLEIIKKALETS